MDVVQNLYIPFYRNIFVAVAYTPDKLSRAMSDFWRVLISGGIKFQLNSFEEIEKQCGIESFKPRFYPPDECHYILAVHESNISFCRCYEHYLGRKPFITKGIEYNHRSSGYTCHGSGKTQGRLVIGAWFLWDGRMVKVTNFKDEKQSLIACEYHPRAEPKRGYEPNKVKKRYTIPHKEFAQKKKNQTG